MMRRASTLAVVLGVAALVASAAVACGDAEVLGLEAAVRRALARDALVRDAQQSLEEARAALVETGAVTPRLRVGASSSAASSAGLDPQSAISGTDYSSQSYSSSVDVLLRGGTALGLFADASTSTTNSQLRTGEGMEFSYAGASVGVGLSQPLGLFRDERALTEGARWEAERSVQRAELGLAEARRGVVSDTLTRFYAAVRARRQAEIAEASAREAHELLRVAEEKLARGKMAEIEVMEAKVGADSAGVALRKAESSAVTALEELKSFLGVSLGQEVELSHDGGAVADVEALDESALTERALARRADLRQLALGVRSAELSVRQAESRARPGVFLTGAYSRSGEAATVGESFRDLINPSWAVGIVTTTSLTRGEDRARADRARGGLRLALLEEEVRREEVRLEVRRLVREARDAAANAALLAETVETAEENLRIRQVQFEHGLVRPIDVMQTERQLEETRSQRLDAVMDAELAAARLRLATGEMPFGRPPEAGASDTGREVEAR